MQKYNRKIDEERMNLGKIRTINNVIEKIERPKSFKNIFKILNFRLVLTTMSLLLVFGVAFITFIDKEVTPPTLSQLKTEKLVETSYMSASVIANAVVDSTANVLSYNLLAETPTNFEENIDEFNYYFNMLKVFIDDDSFSNNAVIENLTDQEYDYKITYSVDNKDFTLYLTYESDKTLTGEIRFLNKILTVDGSFDEKEDEFDLELIARQGLDYIKIEYSSEQETEIEKEYEIKQYINGVYNEKSVKIEKDADETKVEMTDSYGEYKLEKYSENGSTTYFLEYEVSGSEGEVLISETLDSLGNVIFRYHIKEGDIEKDIDLEDPDEDEGDEEDEDDEDDEDEEEDEEDIVNSYLFDSLETI